MDEARRAREEEREKNGKKEPRDPRDPEQRGEQDRPEGGEAGDPRRDDVPVWVVSLPPQVRDMFIRGNFEDVPAEYRDLIERYNAWLNREASRERPSGR